MSIESGSNRAAVKIGFAMLLMTVSVSASRIKPTAFAGSAQASRHAAASALLQPLQIPKARHICRVRPLPAPDLAPARPAFLAERSSPLAPSIP